MGVMSILTNTDLPSVLQMLFHRASRYEAKPDTLKPELELIVP